MNKYITDSLNKTTRVLLNALTILLIITLIQACKDDGDDGPSGPGNGENIVEVAGSDTNFTTLVSVLQNANLVATLEGDGPFTVFAPTNAAFDNLPDSLLDELSNDQLVEILRYHVIGDDISSNELGPQQTVASLSGDSLFITANGTVNVNDSSAVVDADIEASNGVIHAINRVLLPDAYVDVFNIIVKRYNLSSLEQAIRDADLVAILQEETQDGYTIFAPTNEAFSSLPADTLSGLTQEQLQDLLTYHVLPSTVLSTDLSATQTVETVQGDTLVIEASNNTVTVTDSNENTYQVITADLEGTNGVVHVIGGVLIQSE